jgi:ubiquinone/menaquinone biosynthesis C-methylase UbiE
MTDKTIMQPVEELIQVEPAHYRDRKYDTKARFCSYWHQIDEIIRTDRSNVLEVGVGSGFVSNYLRDSGLNVDTLDIDQRLSPTHVGTVTTIPCHSNSYEVVACYEVLEHIPFKDACRALKEIARVSSDWVIISVPNASRAIRLFARLPLSIKLRRIISTPTIRKITLDPAGEHSWEIGVDGYPLSRVEQAFDDAGLEIVRSYRVFENIRHHFFVSRVKK